MNTILRKYATGAKIKLDCKIDGKYVRGLKECQSTNCPKFLNRDLNAALNILTCFEAGPDNRPECYKANYKKK